MKRSESDLLDLISGIYAAGLAERQWHDALERLSAFFGSAGAVAFDLDRTNGQVRAIRTYGVSQGQGEYVERMNAINPRVRFALTQPTCHTSADYEALPEAVIRRHEFYDWLERECGVKYFIGSRMIDAGPVSSFVSVEFAPRHGHATAEQVDLFRRLTPHIANAWRMSRRNTQLLAYIDSFCELMERVPWGVIGIDWNGRVQSLNTRARSIIARDDGLRIVDRTLGALKSAQNRTLQILLSQSLRSARGESLYPGGTMAASRRGKNSLYAVRIMPTRCRGGLTADGVPAVLVLVADPDSRAGPHADDLIAIFGLTRREAELAILIGGGVSLSEAARQMRVARNTARVHLANILSKTAARNQAALVAVIRSLPPATRRN